MCVLRFSAGQASLFLAEMGPHGRLRLSASVYAYQLHRDKPPWQEARRREFSFFPAGRTPGKKASTPYGVSPIPEGICKSSLCVLCALTRVSQSEHSQKKRVRISSNPWSLIWWSWTELNRRPLECHSSALPTELQPRTARNYPITVRFVKHFLRIFLNCVKQHSVVGSVSEKGGVCLNFSGYKTWP